MTRPLISVCLPTYNGEDYLRPAIESILNQTIQDLELVIGDDNSNKETRAILEEYAAKDPRVKLTINEVNLGYVPNCAAIMQRCQGQYIKNFAQDDILELDCCERMLKVIQDNPSVSLVTCSRTLIDENDNVTGVHHHFDKTQIFKGEDIIRLYLTEFVNRTGNPTQIFFRAEHVENGFNPAYHHGEDLEFGLRLCEKGDYYYIHDPLCRYRIHSETTTVSTLADMSFAPDHVRSVDRFIGYAEKAGVSKDNVWQAAIRGLIIKMSHALYVRGMKYDDFPTPKYFGHPEADDKNVKDEPEIFRRLACHLLKYISVKSRVWDEVEKYVRDKKAEAGINMQTVLEPEKPVLDYILNLEQRLQKYEAQASSLSAELETKKQDLLNMQNSSSWKLTRPLRNISSKINSQERRS